MQLLRLWLVSWGVGFLTYIGSLALIYRQTASGGDLSSVVISSLLASGLAFMVVYLPIFRALRGLLRGVHPAWPFPASGVLLGILPTALIVFFWGGSAHSLFSAESFLFFTLFAGTGIALGVGYVRIHRYVEVARI